jgi:serine/threonine protein phosphatase PrpC
MESFIERADPEAEKLLTIRVLVNYKLGIEPEDLYVIVCDGEMPGVFREEELLQMIHNAPVGFIQDTLIELSKREKERGNIRLLITKGEKMWFGQALIPREVVAKIDEMKNDKSN